MALLAGLRAGTRLGFQEAAAGERGKEAAGETGLAETGKGI